MTDIKKKLQDEISVLEYEYLVELPKEILKARAHGDLSENAEYHAAKDRQGFLNARIGHLKKRLADMSMVDFSKIPHNKVGLGSTVVVLDVKRDEEVTYYIVTSEEADATQWQGLHHIADWPRPAQQGSGRRGQGRQPGRDQGDGDPQAHHHPRRSEVI